MTKVLNNIIEVSLIGTGGGYGESIVLKLGDNNWIVIDSCIDPSSQKSLPLFYLKQMGVDVSRDVKLILCTHWHDDHILGISDLLNECTISELSFAPPTDRRKFLQFVGLDFHKVSSESSASSSIELNKCLEISRKRQTKIINAVQDRVLWSHKDEEVSCELISLSPSDFVLEEFNFEVATLMNEYGSSNRKIVSKSPNDKSVALLVKANDHRVILGSDLEISDDNRKGWLCILDNNQCIDLKSSLFKIPHHGSKNAFHKRVWEEIIQENAIAKLTPWNRGGKLPKTEMLRKYKEYTDNLYMTSPLSNDKPKKRDRSISKAINKFNTTLREVKFSLGIVRCRIDISTPEAKWDVELIDNALKVSDEYILRHNV